MMRHRIKTGIGRLLCVFILFMPAFANAQKTAGKLHAPSRPTKIEIKERTIGDLLYYPLSCIDVPMPTREQAKQVVTETFGTCESINNIFVGFHADDTFNFTYRGNTIGICYYDWYDKRTWYVFFFDTKKEADQFYNTLVGDIQCAGIPLKPDNIYGGMSNRKRPISVFKWVAIDKPVKVKEVSPSNIETAEHVGKYKVELFVMKK